MKTTLAISKLINSAWDKWKEKEIRLLDEVYLKEKGCSDLTIQDFKNVEIDQDSIYLLNKAVEIMNDPNHKLYRNQFRFVSLHFYDEKSKKFHLCLAVGLNPEDKKLSYSKAFNSKRVCREQMNINSLI